MIHEPCPTFTCKIPTISPANERTTERTMSSSTMFYQSKLINSTQG
jgi:hypothetical protein